MAKAVTVNAEPNRITIRLVAVVAVLAFNLSTSRQLHSSNVQVRLNGE